VRSYERGGVSIEGLATAVLRARLLDRSPHSTTSARRSPAVVFSEKEEAG
jgi:hypothetical protein